MASSGVHTVTMLGLSIPNLFVTCASGLSMVRKFWVVMGLLGGFDIEGRVDLLFFGIAKNRTA